MPFRDAQDLQQHFEDHQAEFVGVHTPQEYLARAEAFLNGPMLQTALECIRPQGGRTRYDTVTQEYGSVRRDGTIATYFIPDPAIHGLASNLDYYHAHCRLIPREAKTVYTCPVCGYPGLRYPPEDFTICPSCGTEFGYHDMVRTHGELRSTWMRNPQWHSHVVPRPYGWNPWEQLIRAGLVTIGFSATPPRKQVQFVNHTPLAVSIGA